MIFTPEHCELILQSKKTMTRRLVKEGDFVIDWPMSCVFRYMKNGKSRLWRRVGQIYSVNSGRGKKGVGSIGVTDIRRERLQGISLADVKAEGVTLNLNATDDWNDLRRIYFDRWIALWNSINKKKGTRWEDNPEVWVLTFELVTSEGKG